MSGSNSKAGSSNGHKDSSEAWRERIGKIDRRAFELAVARWESGEALPKDDREEAEKLQQELRALARELREQQPDLHSGLSDSISESLLDLKYAITAPPGTSLRLSEYIDSRESEGRGHD